MTRKLLATSIGRSGLRHFGRRPTPQLDGGIPSLGCTISATADDW
jgi:hypothetical protein